MKNKIKWYDFTDKMSYYKFTRIKGKRTKINAKTYKYGTRYWICEELTKDLKEWLLSHKNVNLLISNSQYAPEQITNVVEIWD